MTKTICAVTLVLISIITVGAQTQDNSKEKGPMVIRKSGGVLQSSAVKKVEAVYPPLAKAAQVSGAVVVELTVDEEGNVIASRVISGHPLLKDSAVAAATGWKFKPTTLSGVPVRVIGTITFNFTLGVTPKDIQAFEKAVEKDPISADARYELGSAYYFAERYQEAIKQLLEAIRIKPEFAQAHCKLGLSYGGLRNYNEATGFFKEAIRLDPNYAEAMIGLGLADSVLYLYDEAVANFTRAIELLPRAADAFFGLGMTYSAMGRNDEAISSFKEGLAIRPSEPQPHYSLGLIYARLGNKQAAMQEYTLLKKLEPRLAEELLKEIENATRGNRTKAASGRRF